MLLKLVQIFLFLLFTRSNGKGGKCKNKFRLNVNNFSSEGVRTEAEQKKDPIRMNEMLKMNCNELGRNADEQQKNGNAFLPRFHSFPLLRFLFKVLPRSLRLD